MPLKINYMIFFNLTKIKNTLFKVWHSPKMRLYLQSLYVSPTFGKGLITAYFKKSFSLKPHNPMTRNNNYKAIVYCLSCIDYTPSFSNYSSISPNYCYLAQ